MSGKDIGYYTIPVLLSFRDADKAINDALGDKLTKAAEQSGKNAAKGVADGMKANKSTVSAAAGKIGDEAAEAITKSAKNGKINKAGLAAADEFSMGFSKGVAQNSSGGSGGISDALKGVAGEFGKGLRDGIEQELRSQDILGNVFDGLKSPKFTDAIGGLLDVNITGPVQAITNSLNPLRESIAGFKQGDIAGGLFAATEALRGLEGLGAPKELGDAVARIGAVADESKGQVSGLLGPLQQVTELAGPESKIFKAGTKLPIVGSFLEALPVFDQMNTEAEKLVKNLTGMDIPLSPKSILEWMIDPNRGGVFTTAADKAADALANMQRYASMPDTGMFGPQVKPGALPPGAALVTVPQIFGPNTAPGATMIDPKSGLLVPRKAGGGMINGPGGIDNVPAWLTAGEGIITKDAMGRGGAEIMKWLNAGGKLPGYDKGGTAGLNPGADYLRSTIEQIWPQITDIGGRRAPDGFGEHDTGNAIDIMIPNYNTPAGKELGDEVASFLAKNAAALGLDGMIWRQTSFGYGGSFTKGTPMQPRGNDTQNHFDHVHAILGAGRGQGAPSVGRPSQSLIAPAGSAGASQASGGITASGGGAGLGNALSSGSAGTRGGGGGSGGGGASGNPMELLKIGLGGILETFGLDGSFLPDISNLAPVKAVGTLLNAFGGPQTSDSPFGIADQFVAPPAAGALPGIGSSATALPGGPSINIDQSIHGNVGEDPEQVRRQRDAGLTRALARASEMNH